ncbi:MAG: hypothetical protein ACOC2W_01655, partial [bacterium]
MEKKDLLEKIENIKNKNSRFIFFAPEITEPSASIYEIFFHAHVMKSEGYNTVIFINGETKEKPYWIEEEILDVDIELSSEAKLKVGPEDVVVIPEILTNVFEQTQNLPSIRVGLLQSIDYMLNGLLPGTNWSQFNIYNVVTTSKTLKDIFENFMGKNFNINVYNIGIPEYFKNKVKNKKPTIPIVYRNKNDITKIVKLFYMKYPQYSWVSFDGMVYDGDNLKQLSRYDFSRKLDSSFAALWIDKISSFGTFPIECFKTRTIPIGIIPDIFPDYLNEDLNLGLWSDNIYEIPDIIAKVIENYLEESDSLEKIYKDLEAFDDKFTQEESKKEIVSLYENLLIDRKESL